MDGSNEDRSGNPEAPLPRGKGVLPGGKTTGKGTVGSGVLLRVMSASAGTSKPGPVG